MFVTPGWWESQRVWFLNVDLAPTRAAAGIAGAIAPDSWLPALSDGSSMGPMPASLQDRYVDLYQKFTDSWRVTSATSLFDYAPGTSTDTFTMKNWPPERPPCALPGKVPAEPTTEAIAKQACAQVAGEGVRRNCVFDVMVTGHTGFATAYVLSQGLQPEAPAPQPHPKVAVFLDFGAGIPNGTFSNSFNIGFSFNTGLEFPINSHVSAEAIFGVHRFPETIAGRVNLYQLSANMKIYLSPPPNKFRPFVNGGIGAYKFGSGSTNFGGNVGAGILYELTPQFGLQGSYNFHTVNTPVSATRFSTLQGGVRFVF